MASATKQALLAALSAAQGECISGQQLAQQLGVSRAAVHKAAAALAAQGYALEAARRVSAGGRRPSAPRRWGVRRPIYLYDKLESSNRTAKTLALEGMPHGTMVLTSQQTAGRGRLGRRFESPAGKGIYLAGAAARPAHDRGAGRHRQRGGGRLPGCEAALRAGLGHQVGQRPLL